MDLILMKIGVKKMKQKINNIMNLMDSIEYSFKDETGENIINANPQKWDDEFYKYIETQKLIKTNKPLYFYHLVNKDVDMNKGIISL